MAGELAEYAYELGSALEVWYSIANRDGWAPERVHTQGVIEGLHKAQSIIDRLDYESMRLAWQRREDEERELWAWDWGADPNLEELVEREGNPWKQSIIWLIRLNVAGSIKRGFKPDKTMHEMLDELETNRISVITLTSEEGITEKFRLVRHVKRPGEG